MTNDTDVQIVLKKDGIIYDARPEDVADMLCIDIPTVRRYSREGRLPCAQYNRMYFYNIEQIEACITPENFGRIYNKLQGVPIHVKPETPLDELSRKIDENGLAPTMDELNQTIELDTVVNENDEDIDQDGENTDTPDPDIAFDDIDLGV